MKLVVQRVSSASLSVKSEVISEIKQGFFVLVGIKEGDTEAECDLLAEKLSKLRVMADAEGKMNLSVKDVDGQMLVVSQFTLHADTKGGNRPSFIHAAPPSEAQPLYDHFVEKLRSLGIAVKTGRFGAEMEIKPVLSGPVTIVMDSDIKN